MCAATRSARPQPKPNSQRRKKKPMPGECILVSQDEARVRLVPIRRATLSVTGQRPVVGSWDNTDLVYSFAVMKVVTEQLLPC
jgi:hypothetical protein